MISGANKLAVPVITEIIEEARDAEVCRNIAMMREALAPVWPDIEINPDYAGFDTLLEARLLRLSGFLLSFVGKSCNRPDYHPRGKDLLSAAVNLFGSVNAADEEAEANIMLALAYWYAGEVEECEAILNVVDDMAASRSGHIVLQLSVHRLMTLYYQERFNEARQLVESFGSISTGSYPIRHLAAFYNQAGLVYEKLGDFSTAAKHLDLALSAARNAGNARFEGLFLNNRAVLNLGAGNLKDAMADANESILLFRKLDDHGWIPHILDTKALVLLESGNVAEALGTIDEAIEQFLQGADHAGLCDAEWTRIRILIRLGRMEDAIQCYGRLYTTANKFIGASAAAKYTRLLVDELGLEVRCKNIVRIADLSAFDGRDHIDIFFVAASVLSAYGVCVDSAVPVRQVRTPRPGMLIMYASENGELHLSRIKYDSFASLFYIDQWTDFPTPIDQLTLIGEVFGHRPFDQTESGRLEFFDLPE